MGTAFDELSIDRAGPAAHDHARESSPPAAWSGLPPRMKALYIAPSRRSDAWLAEALAADPLAQVVFEEVQGGAAGLARLRDELFDLVLVSHDPKDLDSLELTAGLRASGFGEPLIVLGAASEQELAAAAFESGADAYVCVNTITSRRFLWTTARVVERHRLLRENQRLEQSERQRLQQEHLEAERLLAQQRALVHDIEALTHGAARCGSAPGKATSAASAANQAPASRLPPALVDHYRELLRAYVIMGSGNLVDEMNALAELLASAGITAQETMLLHVQVLEELVRGLGNRSARHVMNRADLLVLELMVHLAEGYRQRFLQGLLPVRQQILPGFEKSSRAA